MPLDKLPDILASNLDVVFVGTAAGKRSAYEGHYYANPSNRFWRTAKEIGLLPRNFRPEEDREAVNHGVGFTDLCKVRAGSDAEIGKKLYDRSRFEKAIRKFNPRIVAFTSKEAASVWLGLQTGKIEYGEQADSNDGFPPVFVLPSPSGQASKYWDDKYWHDLAHWIKRKRRA